MVCNLKLSKEIAMDAYHWNYNQGARSYLEMYERDFHPLSYEGSYTYQAYQENEYMSNLDKSIFSTYILRQINYKIMHIYSHCLGIGT